MALQIVVLMCWIAQHLRFVQLIVEPLHVGVQQCCVRLMVNVLLIVEPLHVGMQQYLIEITVVVPLFVTPVHVTLQQYHV